MVQNSTTGMIRREGHLYCFYVFVCDRFITASVTSHSNGRKLGVACANLGKKIKS